MSEQFRQEAQLLYDAAVAAIPAAKQNVEKMKEPYAQLGLPTKDTRTLGKIIKTISDRKATNRTQKSIAEEFGLPPSVIKQAAKVIDAENAADWDADSVSFNDPAELEDERIQQAVSKPLTALMELRWAGKYDDADPETDRLAKEYEKKVHALIDALDHGEYAID